MDNIGLSAEEEKEIWRVAALYKREAKKCSNVKAYLAGCVLIGATIEALLLLWANCHKEIVTSAKSAPKRKREVRPLREWSFFNLLRATEKLNLLPSGLSKKDEWNDAKAKIGDYVELVRQIRNLIHPARFITAGFKGKKVRKEYYEACYRILETASDYLLEKAKNILKDLKDEQK